MKNIKHLLAVSLLLISASVLAVPAKRVKKTIMLSDGTQKEVVLVGDENIHYYLDAENNAYTCNNEGVYVKSERRMLESKWEARLAQRNKHRLERAEARGMSIHPKILQEPSFRHRAQWGAEQNPVSGDKKGLVILVNFSDWDLNAAHRKDFYNKFFNTIGFSEAGGMGSVHDYFYECSYTQLNLTFDVYGPVTVSKSYSYYGKNAANGYDLYPGEMVEEACALADELGADFSKYDWDGDGQVDQVLIVYAGYGENADAPDNTIWPHESTLTEEAQYGDGEGPVSYDDVIIDTYAVTCELDGTSGSIPAGIGTACHEFSHCMCLPDFYDTTERFYGMNSWDLMDYGSYSGENYNGNCPAPYTSYERMYCGWLTPKVLDEPCVVSNMKTLYGAPEAYIIYNDANPNEYYMLENRQSEGFGAYDPAKGLLVLHVYFDSEVWARNGVNSTEIQRMTIIPADGILSKLTEAGDTWPGETGKTELSDTSFPAATLYTENSDGVKLMSKPIEDIKDIKGKISFVFNGGVNMDVPVASEATEVKNNAFTAHWNAIEGATGYKVMLTAEDKEEQQYSLADIVLLQEDFCKFNNGKTSDGSKDISEALDEYTNIAGWKGEKLYTTPGNEIKMSTGKQGGYIRTPWLRTGSKAVTVVFTARKYKDDAEPLKLCRIEGETIYCVDEVELKSEPTRTIFYTETTSNDIRWELSCDKRCYISEMCIYDGKLTEEQITEGVVCMRKIETSIVETEDTSYEFSNLSNQRKYTYSVCALKDQAYSKWSNVIEVILPTDELGIDVVHNSQITIHNSEGVYDLSGRKISNELKKGIYIVNGKKFVK